MRVQRKNLKNNKKRSKIKIIGKNRTQRRVLRLNNQNLREQRNNRIQMMNLQLRKKNQEDLIRDNKRMKMMTQKKVGKKRNKKELYLSVKKNLIKIQTLRKNLRLWNQENLKNKLKKSLKTKMKNNKRRSIVTITIIILIVKRELMMRKAVDIFSFNFILIKDIFIIFLSLQMNIIFMYYFNLIFNILLLKIRKNILLNINI